MYLWHLVDVLRIGTERLLTLTLDAERGIPCWDENALAENRRYAQLSPLVGWAVLERAVPEWIRVAESTSDEAQADHPVFRALGALDVIHSTLTKFTTTSRTSSAGGQARQSYADERPGG